jgi:carbon monoxide dehydrogenase subunit G
MPTKLMDEITIQAPREKVYAMISDPTRLPDWVPSLGEVRNVSGTGIGQTHEWTYKMVGLPFKGRSEVVEVTPPSRRVTRTTGGIESTWTFDLEEEGGGATNLSLAIEYTIPVPVVRKLAERLVRRRNERELKHGLEHLKEILEL